MKGKKKKKKKMKKKTVDKGKKLRETKKEIEGINCK